MIFRAPTNVAETTFMVLSPFVYFGSQLVEYMFKPAPPKPKIVQVNSNYIDLVTCYSDSVTNWDATNGNPFNNNHIKKIIVYNGAKVNFIKFTPELTAQYNSLVNYFDAEFNLQDVDPEL